VVLRDVPAARADAYAPDNPYFPSSTSIGGMALPSR